MKPKPPRITQRNPIAKSLRSPHLRQQQIPDRKQPAEPDWDELLEDIEERFSATLKHLGEN